MIGVAPSPATHGADGFWRGGRGIRAPIEPLVRPSPSNASTLALLLALGAACGHQDIAPPASPSTEVRPLIGTGGLGFGVGSIPPGPTLPFGLAKPGPDTALDGSAPSFEHCAGYWYEDNEIRGFSQLHLSGTGVPDYGVIMLMPALALPAGPLKESVWSSRLEHRNEQASVGYYKIQLVPSAITVEIGATAHTALYRLSYPSGQEANLILSLGHGLGSAKTRDGQLQIDVAKREVTGWLHHEGSLSGGRGGGYRVDFVMRFDQPIVRTETFGKRARIAASTSTSGPDAGAVLTFSPAAAGGVVRVQIALSFIDLDTARQNLTEEWMEYDLDRARAKATEAWDRVLRRVEVEGGTPAFRHAFYTALFHAHHMPTLFTEAGGRYRGLDGQVHQASGFTYYSDFSLWDTFRTLHPLMTLIEPETQLDFDRTLVAMMREGSRIPKWPLATRDANSMIGYHGETVLAHSYLSGVRDFDVEEAYRQMKAAAWDPRDAVGQGSGRKRDCMGAYLTHGYCPSDIEGGSVSKTVENAFSDFVLSRFASALGHDSDAALFSARANGWSHLFNARSGYLEGRKSDGSFAAAFQEDLFGNDYIEGNARQWSTFVPHDPHGLAAKLGGDDALVAQLGRLFENAAMTERTPLPDPWYWAGNEPDIHAPYMFAELGRPDLTGRWVRWIMEKRYDDTPAGLPGNDDGGTMSAWYVFSALGLYPKIAEARYVLGRPLFSKATLHFAGGRDFVIRATGSNDSQSQVKRVTLNGAILSDPYIRHEDIVRGGALVFELERR